MDASDLMAVLPAWSSFRRRRVGGAPAAPASDRLAGAGVALVRPALTIVLSWDGACAALGYDVKAGRTTAPRAGLAELLLALADADAEVVFWSGAAGAASAADALGAFVRAHVVPADAPRVRAFRAFLAERQELARAMHAAAAAAAGARGGAPPPRALDAADYDELYIAAVLRVAAVLGREHCLGGAGAAAATEDLSRPSLTPQGVLRPVPLLAADRSAWNVLVVGASPAAAFALPSAGAQPPPPPPPPPPLPDDAAHMTFFQVPPARRATDADADADPTLFLLADFVRRFADWRADALARGAARRGNGGAAAAAAEDDDDDESAFGVDTSVAAFVATLVARAEAQGLLAAGSADARTRTRALLRLLHTDLRARVAASAGDDAPAGAPPT